MSKVAIFLILAVMLLISSKSSAEETKAADDESEKAQALFQKGADLYENSAFDRAADAFRQAYAIRPSWKLYYNIGQSEAAAKHYGLALEAFEKYLAEGGDDVEKERSDEVEGSMGTWEQRYPLAIDPFRLPLATPGQIGSALEGPRSG